MSDIEGLPLKPDIGQRSLFSLAKVVRLGTLPSSFDPDQIAAFKDDLLDASRTKHELLIILRKLDCFKFEVSDIQKSGIGTAVATLAYKHPKHEISRLSNSILHKWRDLVEQTIFNPCSTYDIEAAASAPDGEAAAPEALIALEKKQQRQDKLDRRRRRIEEDFMASSSEDEIERESEEEDPDWGPKKGGKPSSKRKSKDGSEKGGNDAGTIIKKKVHRRNTKTPHAFELTDSTDIFHRAPKTDPVDKKNSVATTTAAPTTAIKKDGIATLLEAKKAPYLKGNDSNRKDDNPGGNHTAATTSVVVVDAKQRRIDSVFARKIVDKNPQADIPQSLPVLARDSNDKKSKTQEEEEEKEKEEINNG